MLIYGLSVAYMFTVDYFGITKLLVQFPAQFRLFVTGILLYVMFDKLKDKNIYILAGISFILIVLFKDYVYFKFTFYPLLLGLIMIYLVYFTKHIKINFDFSYSFYILHFPVIQLVLYFGINPTNPIVSFLSLFGVVLVLSYFSEKYIEKKFIRIGKNIVKKNTNKKINYKKGEEI